ncbi:hypothetical protein ACFXAZ_39460 [Streptomyces sp. NPDC059477]|uniref:hypothetical protein n=1 Tax=Streptomyces sp. NPDC059477 TaxID=3346847 RepID=UPI003679D12E
MAQNSWPQPGYNDRAVTDSEYEYLAARYSDDGVYGTPTSTQVVTAGTGRTVNIRTGVRASLRGHAWYSGTSTVTLPIDANTSGSTRVDWVVLRLDRSDWTVTAAIRKGTPGSGTPALVQTEADTGLYEIPLARVTLLTGAGTVTVARAELYVGTRTRPCTSTTRNPTPRMGEMGYETNTGRVVLWTGSSWQIVADDSGTILIDSPLSAWSISVQSVLELRNGSVHLRMGSFERAAGTLAGTTTARMPVLIPAAYRHPSRDQYALAWLTGNRIGRMIIYSAASDRPGQVWITNKPSIATGEFVLPVSGISWAV